MKCTAWIYACAIAGGMFASNAMAQGLRQPLSVRPTAFDYNHYLQDDVASPSDAVAEAAGDATSSIVEEAAPAESSHHDSHAPVYTEAAPSASAPVASSCQTCGPTYAAPACSSCGCNTGCGCGSLGLDLGGLVGDCCLGDAWTLKSQVLSECSPLNIGGWFAMGYATDANDLFLDVPDRINVTQAWMFLEKLADPTCGNIDWGFRADFMYGVDADDTQAFGNDPGEWDYLNGFDHGVYGWAIPQLYGELAGDGWSVKAGHFYTLVGYEVVTAPDNFFYSHAMTMFNSEPFTHTGVIGSYSVSDNLEVYAGWTLGWDTGFDQFNDGSSFLGGFSATLSDDVTFTYISTAGNFGWRGDDGYSHSMVLDTQLTDNLNYVLQSDLVRVDATGEDNVGINQYFLYSVNDCLGLGTRLEWWKGDSLTGYAPHGGALPATGSHSYYAATFGANIRPDANLIFRPEVRYDWSPALGYDETIFAVDAILTF